MVRVILERFRITPVPPAEALSAAERGRIPHSSLPLPVRERMKVRFFVQRAIFFARDSRFCVRTLYPTPNLNTHLSPIIDTLLGCAGVLGRAVARGALAYNESAREEA